MKKIGKIMSVLVAVAMLAAVATISVSAEIPAGAANSWTDPSNTIRIEFSNPGNNANMDLILINAAPAGDLEITFNEIEGITDGANGRFKAVGGAAGARFEGAVIHNDVAFFSAFVSNMEMRANERVARFDFDEDEEGLIGWVSLTGTVTVGTQNIALSNVILTNAVIQGGGEQTTVTTIGTPQPTTPPTTVDTPSGDNTTVASVQEGDETSAPTTTSASSSVSQQGPPATPGSTTDGDVVKGGVTLAIIPTLVAAAAAVVVARRRK